MTRWWGKLIWGAILAAMVGWGCFYALRRFGSRELYVSPNSISAKMWPDGPVEFASAEAIDFAPMEGYVPEKLLLTFSEKADFNMWGQVMNQYCQSGIGTVLRWRIEDTAETRYEFPSFEERSAMNWLSFLEPGGEDLALVHSQGKTVCSLTIKLTPEGMWLNENRMTDTELESAIATIIGTEKVDYRFVWLVATQDTPLSLAKGIFNRIARESWHYQVSGMEEENGDFVSLPSAWNRGSIPSRSAERFKRRTFSPDEMKFSPPLVQWPEGPHMR